MLKKTGVLLFSAALILSGCGEKSESVKPEVKSENNKSQQAKEVKDYRALVEKQSAERNQFLQSVKYPPVPNGLGLVSVEKEKLISFYQNDAGFSIEVEIDKKLDLPTGPDVKEAVLANGEQAVYTDNGVVYYKDSTTGFTYVISSVETSIEELLAAAGSLTENNEALVDAQFTGTDYLLPRNLIDNNQKLEAIGAVVGKKENNISGKLGNYLFLKYKGFQLEIFAEPAKLEQERAKHEAYQKYEQIELDDSTTAYYVEANKEKSLEFTKDNYGYKLSDNYQNLNKNQLIQIANSLK